MTATAAAAAAIDGDVRLQSCSPPTSPANR